MKVERKGLIGCLTSALKSILNLIEPKLSTTVKTLINLKRAKIQEVSLLSDKVDLEQQLIGNRES